MWSFAVEGDGGSGKGNLRDEELAATLKAHNAHEHEHERTQLGARDQRSATLRPRAEQAILRKTSSSNRDGSSPEADAEVPSH